MNILITGGTGFIGSAFINQHKTNHHFTVLTRNMASAVAKLPSNCTCIASLDQFDSLDRFDAVINLAGEAIIERRWSNAQKNIICDSRWQTTQTLVDLLLAGSNPPKVFLSGSAIGIYGNAGNQTLTEETPIAPTDFPSKLCKQWEDIAQQACDQSRVVLMRTGIVLAKEAGALSKMLLPFKLCLGGNMGSGTQYMSWIHIEDVIRAIDLLLANDAIAGPVNIVGPAPVCNKSFTRTLAKTLKRFAIFHLPKPALNIIFGEASCLLLDSQHVMPRVLESHGFTFKHVTLEQALNNILSTH